MCCIVLLGKKLWLFVYRRKYWYTKAKFVFSLKHCIVHSHCNDLCNDFSQGRSSVFSYHLPRKCTRCRPWLSLPDTWGMWGHLNTSFQTISGSPFQSFCINKMSLYFSWFCTWFTVDSVEILIVLFGTCDCLTSRAAVCSVCFVY